MLRVGSKPVEATSSIQQPEQTGLSELEARVNLTGRDSLTHRQGFCSKKKMVCSCAVILIGAASGLYLAYKLNEFREMIQGLVAIQALGRYHP